MAAMDFKIGSAVVGKCLNYKFLPVAKKIISYALDGTVYAQSTGKATNKYEVDIYCSTSLGRAAVDTASLNCSEVILCDRGGAEHVGFIEEETIDWKEWKDGHGVGHFTVVQE